jgi:hypothetical protein
MVTAFAALLGMGMAGGVVFALANGLVPGSGSFAAPRLAPLPSARQPGVTLMPDPASPFQLTCTEGERDVFGQSVEISASQWLCGNLSVYGGSATVDGRVGGNVTVIGGSATISGTVDGNVTAIGGSILLATGARVGGNVDALGGHVRRGAGTYVGGDINQSVMEHDIVPLRWLGFSATPEFPWARLLFWVLAGAGVTLLFPRQLARVRSVAAREFAVSFVAGLAAVVLAVVAAAILVLTCLGIPIALLLMVAVWLAWVVGVVAIGSWLGSALLRVGFAGEHSPTLATLVGVVVLSLAGSIPCAGGVISFVTGCAGLGAVALALLTHRRTSGRRTLMV